MRKILILEMSIAWDVSEVEKCKVRFSSAQEVARKNFLWPMLIESGSRIFSGILENKLSRSSFN